MAQDRRKEIPDDDFMVFACACHGVDLARDGFVTFFREGLTIEAIVNREEKLPSQGAGHDSILPRNRRDWIRRNSGARSRPAIDPTLLNLLPDPVPRERSAH